MKPATPSTAQEVPSQALLHLKTQLPFGSTLRFDEFMAFALYHPQCGYYSQGQAIFGARGDFVTAPQATPLFGLSLAQGISPILRNFGNRIIEFGAGNGQLAQILLQGCGQSLAEYCIVELSGGLKHIQEARLRNALPPAMFAKVRWLGTLPDTLEGVVLGNELLDAMPVRRFQWGNAPSACPQQHEISPQQVYEAHVQWTCPKCEVLEWAYTPADPGLTLHATRLAEHFGPWPQGYESEWHEQALAWLTTVADRLHGLCLLIDYGKSASEYYLPHHSRGHLRAHSQHTAHDGFLRKVGQQDLTSHVNFSAVFHAAQRAGLELEGYCSQGPLLLGLGLLDQAQEMLVACSPHEQAREKQAIHMLTSQAEMGESFKAICFSKGRELPEDCLLRTVFLAADESGRL
ncbi:MAG: class I SAM-dependent methyltransferase [Limnobacter sp.]|nr:class I SAM-dependent methyltransferase [Limnobacter sp.]